MSKKSYMLQAFVETPWAIVHSKLLQLEDIVARHVAGEKLDAEEVQARVHGATRPPERRVNKVGVLPLFGTIFPRANLMTDMSGATSAERFGAQFSALVNDAEVDAIVLDVDSPGGQVNGIQELADLIFRARGKKPIVAVANHMMASAAYWIGTAADEIVVSPSGEVGSIGVFAVHEDISGALAQDGVKVSIIKAGKYKAEANPYEALSDDARGAIQESVRESYDAFVGAVARHRGVDADSVRNGFGEGRMVSAQRAVEIGMADRVETLQETIERLFNGKVSSASAGVSTLTPSPSRFDALSATPEGRGEHNDGQEPVVADELSPLAQARERLITVQTKTLEGDASMRIRQLQAERALLVARAQELFDAAEKEGRDFTEAERAEFDALMGVGESAGTISALDAKIDQIVDDREKLRAAVEKKFDAGEAIKPDAEAKKTMKRAEFETLDPAAQAAYVKHGGKIEQ